MNADPLMQKYAHLEDEGMREFLVMGERFYPQNAVDFTIAEQREFYDRYCALFAASYPTGLTARDFYVGVIRCRRYAPAKANSTLLFYLHGGGFILGGIDSHDAICADLADQTQCEVVALDYRLAPEHPFPAAFEDCWKVLNHLSREDKNIIVAGDSAGGNLSVALSIKARDLGLHIIKAQVLFYPGLGGDTTKGSYISQANAPGLTTKDTLYYRDTYKGGGSKFAEPLREIRYENLPSAFVIAAGLDPLHDDSVNYVARLQAAGVAAELRSEPQLVHAFLRARRISKAAGESFRAAVAAIIRFAA